MFDFIFPTRLRRLFHVLVPALALAAASLSAQETEVEPATEPALSVAGAQGEAADLVLYLRGQEDPEPPRRAVVVVLSEDGATVAKAGVPVGPGISPARLPGFQRLVPAHGPSYRVQVLDAVGRPLAPETPLRVRLLCGEPQVCRFRFDTGISAPGALVVDWDLAQLFDITPAPDTDLASWTAAHAPELLGDARTLAWQLGPITDTRSCECRWVLANKRPHGRCGGNGDELGLEGTFMSAKTAEVTLTQEAGIALEQRCWRAIPGGTDGVTVLAGNESLTLRLSRPILAPCAAPCAPSIHYGADLTSRAFAEVGLAVPPVLAGAGWAATLLADGTPLFNAHDERIVEVPNLIADRTQTDAWTDTAGNLSELILRSQVAASFNVHGKSSYMLAVAGITWRLEARGHSACTMPQGVVGVTTGAPLFAVIPGLPNADLANGLPPDSGQIRVLSSSECPPGTTPRHGFP